MFSSLAGEGEPNGLHNVYPKGGHNVRPLCRSGFAVAATFVTVWLIRALHAGLVGSGFGRRGVESG